MAHDIKLDVFTIQIKEGRKKFLGFDKFYTKPGEDNVDKLYSFNNLFDEYISSFNSKFMIHVKSLKGIALITEQVKYNSRNRTIRGYIEGGNSGVGSKIKNKDNISDNDAFKVGKNDVDAIPFYFLIWMPSDSNLGLVIIQSLGNKSVTDIFKVHFKQFFSEYFEDKVKLSMNDLIPKELIDKTKGDGVINSVVFRRLRLPSDKAEKILGLKYEANDLTIEVRITGLRKVNGAKEKLMKFITGETNEVFDITSLDDYGIDGQHDTIVTFEHNGKKAQGKRSKEFKIAPSYYIDEGDIQRDDDNHPTWKSIDDYCLSFLTVLKKQINYEPVIN